MSNFVKSTLGSSWKLLWRGLCGQYFPSEKQSRFLISFGHSGQAKVAILGLKVTSSPNSLWYLYISTKRVSWTSRSEENQSSVETLLSGCGMFKSTLRYIGSSLSAFYPNKLNPLIAYVASNSIMNSGIVRFYNKYVSSLLKFSTDKRCPFSSLSRSPWDTAIKIPLNPKSSAFLLLITFEQPPTSLVIRTGIFWLTSYHPLS